MVLACELQTKGSSCTKELNISIDNFVMELAYKVRFYGADFSFCCSDPGHVFLLATCMAGSIGHKLMSGEPY